MLPDQFAAPPPPPPPPPAARGRALLLIGLAAALTVGAILAVVLLAGDGTGAVSTSTTAPATTTSAPTSTSAPTTTTDTIPVDLAYTEGELAYFAEIAGWVEYGAEGGVIHKWVEDLLIVVHGAPTDADRAALDDAIADLNALIGPVRLRPVPADPNVEIYFLPESDFPAVEPNYVAGNKGFAYVWWDGTGTITRARVLISTTGVSPEERAHLIREELTQSLGLLADSWEYPDSIFYQGWTTVQRFSPMDEAVIEMLYRPEILPGTTVDEAVAILATLDRY